jgi:SNF2 family DNA or RNA helicase
MNPILYKKNVKILDYQIECLDWMRNIENNAYSEFDSLKGGLVCISMGGGKTFTALAHITREQNDNKEEFPTLIVASKTVILEWKTQIEKFIKKVSVLFFHKDFIKDGVNSITAEEIKKYNIVLTTYDMILGACRKLDASKKVCIIAEEGLQKGKIIEITTRNRPKYNPSVYGQKLLFDFPWQRIFCDESQKFANYKTKIYKAVMSIYGKYKFCLTGTPIKNYDTDIWSQMRFIGYQTIKNARRWSRSSFIRDHLDRYIFFRDHEQINLVLPEKREETFEIEMSEHQKQVYKNMLIQMKKEYAKMLEKTVSFASVLALFTRLRQTAIAPYLILPKNNETKFPYSDKIMDALGCDQIEKWIKDPLGSAGIDSPKIKQIVDIVSKVTGKILIFSMFTSCLSLIEKAIEIDLPETASLFLDGKVQGEQRLKIIEEASTDSSIKVLFVQYKVGGEGLNLQAFNHVICIEPWWNDSTHSQAIARAHRRGQDKPVYVYWILSKNTIERPILNLCENKKALAKSYTHNEYYNPKSTGLTKWELERLINSE